MSHESSEMVEEAKQISHNTPNIVVKVPLIMEGLKATKKFCEMDIKTNVTFIFSASQALLAENCGATYASVFVGRLDDIGHNGIDDLRDVVDIFSLHNYSTQVITASKRNPMHVLLAAKVGSHVVTIPPPVIKQISRHNLTDAELEILLIIGKQSNHKESFNPHILLTIRCEWLYVDKNC